jgi:tetratricopeptide (TPR) repeat protein
VITGRDREATISQADQIAPLLASVAARRGLPPIAMAAMMADWLRRAGSTLPGESLLDRKARDFLVLSKRLATPLGDAEIKRLRDVAATALVEGRFAEADKSLAQAELHAIGGSSDLAALPLERRMLIGENRADRAALSFLRTTSEAYRESAARYGEASALIGLAAIDRSREAALEQAKVLARISEDFGGREGYDAAIAALRRVLEGLDSLADTVAFAGAQEALASALDKLAALTGDAKLLDEALVHCRAGIEDLRHDEAPELWRALKLRLGKLAVNLGVSQKDDNLLEEAVATYATALAVWKRSDDEARWLEAEHMISRARGTLGRRRSDLSLLERAFNGLNRVSQAIDRSRDPMRWAELQDQMGGVLAAMGERYSEPVVIEEAIAAFAAALEEYRQERAPLLWAQTRANQAEAMLQLARRNKDKALAQQALTQLMAATQTAGQTVNGGAVAADLQKRLAAAGATATKLITG